MDAFLEHGIVAMGAELLGKLPANVNKADLLRLQAQRYPEDKEARRATFVSQLYRFLTEVREGDLVVSYAREQRAYLWGEVASGYEWIPGVAEGAPHVRRVRWTGSVPRDALSPSTRYTLGAIQTFFRLSEEAATDMHAQLQPIGAKPNGLPPPEASADTATD